MSTTLVYPQSKEEAGKSYWSVLFNTAAQYPEIPTEEDRKDINNYIKSTIKNFVCDDCIQHSFEYIKEHPIRNHNRDELVQYLCELKNHSNRHEGKETIDCNEFVGKAVDKNAKATCKSCLIDKVRAPTVSLEEKKQSDPQPQVQQPQSPQYAYYIPPTGVYNPGTGFTYANMGRILGNYDSVKRAMNLNDASAYKTQQSQAFISSNTGVVATTPPPPPQGMPQQMGELSQRYPTLAGIDLNLDSGNQQEELEGVLKSLDGIYKLPAEIVGIPAPQMNLAYTPEALTNGVSLITQMYLTNAGSMLATLLSSITLMGISVFAKNSIANYDRLFIQNIAGSFLFHTLNFLNPRAKDDLMPDLKKLFEGATKGDIAKVKEAILYKNKEESNAVDKSAQKLLDQIKSKKGLIDMKKLAANHKDLRSIAAHGYGSTGGTLTRDEFDSLIDNDDLALISGDGVNLENIVDNDDQFGAILGSGGF